MRIDANLMDPPLDRVAEITDVAEEMGFDGAWVTELTHSPFTLMTRAAAATDELDIGTAIALAFPRSPMVTAYTAWDLQRSSNGRFLLGLGTQVKGHIERRFGMTWDSPGPRLREYVLALQEIWDAWEEGRPPDFQGEHYSITLCPPKFVPDVPDDPRVPIYVAGVNEYNVRLAGELCDGLHVHPFHSPEYVEEEVVPHVREGARSADRSLDDVTLATSVFAVVGDTEAERERCREEVREELAFYASTRTYRKILAVHGWGDVSDRLHELSVNDEWDRMPELVTDEMVDAFSVEGRWDELHDRIEARYEHLDRVAVYTPFRGEDHWRHLSPSA
ncbi:TIGR03617 family F420-dependent LLM class oxidoreductase [Natronomonas marina]|jgi:probable F420-dependent oxidoreductase|uniref:TIGR03617 family F420-dependent LLM class oxidoreductase n=1 Tax=Natronomonas marina TaxID=2961939 RepID=UPI0020C961A1|nr:TIGR03617 family F420-dependent LLM class oxidoreductase [Natronomonas marina]